jgi:hypothetical protein
MGGAGKNLEIVADERDEFRCVAFVPAVNVSDNVIRVDLAPCGAAQISHGGGWHRRALTLMPFNRGGKGPNVALNLLFRKRGHLVPLEKLHGL